MASDHTIGYGKPPPEFRFKPGQSGNPKGAPRKKKTNLFGTFKEFLNGKVGARDNDRVRIISNQEAMVRRMVADATKCNQKAFAIFLRLAKKAGELKDLSPIITGGVLVIKRKRTEDEQTTANNEIPKKRTKKRRKRRRDPRMPRNLMTIFKEVISERVTLAGRKMTRGEAVIFANGQKALAGNQKAMHNLFMLAEQEGLFKDLSDPKQAGAFLVVGERPRTSEELEKWFPPDYVPPKPPIILNSDDDDES